MTNDNLVELPKPKRLERKEEVKQERRRRGRVGLERNMKLAISPELLDPAYEYRWINDTPGRLDQKTKLDDWDIVMETKGNEGEGTPYKRGVGWDGGGNRMYAYLCRKRKEYYEGDKRAEQKIIEDQENAVLTYKKAAGAEGLDPNAPDVYVPSKH